MYHSILIRSNPDAPYRAVQPNKFTFDRINQTLTIDTDAKSYFLEHVKLHTISSTGVTLTGFVRQPSGTGFAPEQFEVGIIYD